MTGNTRDPMSFADGTGAPEDGRGTDAARQEVVENLFREHNQALLAFLRARLASEQAARDVAQEAYVKLLQLDRPQEIGFLRAYLYKIAANLAIDHRRRQQTQDKVASESALFEFVSAETQYRELESKQALHIIKNAVAELPPACRQAFVLSRTKGWSSAKIGACLGTTDRTVRNYITRALEHIQRRLTEKTSLTGIDNEHR